MKATEYKTILENIVHRTLYECSSLSKQDKEKLNEIRNYLKKSKSFIEDLRTIISSRNSENAFAYCKYISTFLNDCKKEIKLDILNNSNQYEDIMCNEALYINLWDSLTDEDKVNYLLGKKKLTDIDYIVINHSSCECGKFKTSKVLEEILKNEKLQSKIADYSIELNYSYSLLSNININDYKLCRMFTKESYTNLLLKKCDTFDEFKAIVESNKRIFRLLNRNSLIFSNDDNEKIYKFLLKNHEYIGKFDIKYTDLFSILEIAKISEDENLDSDTFSTVIQALYRFNNEKPDKIFSIDNLKKCPKHSISVNPLSNVSEELKKEILNNYAIFNRFVDTIMIEIISDNYEEDDILNILRNDEFIKDMSPYAIELLLNKLSFKSSFNMLQRSIIFKKINNLNVKVSEKDRIFFKGFLDSPILLYKSEHSMIFDMLNMMEKEDILYYLPLPYINKHISNYEIVSLIKNKDVDVIDVIDSVELLDKLNTTDIISIIDKSFEKNPDLKIFKDQKLCKLLFGIDDETFNRLNIDEVNYLFENIRMKSLLSKRESKPTILSYKAVIACYLLFGLEETLRIVTDGNTSITLDQVKRLQSDVVNERLLMFKENNSNVFENLNKKIASCLNRIGYIENKNDLSIQMKKSTFLDNFTYMVLDSNYDTYNNVLNLMYDYTRQSKIEEYKAMQSIYNYTQDFTSHYLNNIANKYNQEFDEIIINNFEPKDSVLYNKRKEVGRDFLTKLKFKLFVKTLTDPNKDAYKVYYKDECSLERLEDDYKKYLAKTEVHFDSLLNHVLIPTMNERFDKENCLNKLGISKPKDTDIYLNYLKDVSTVDYINKKLVNFKKKYEPNEVLTIMNAICYDSKVDFKLTNTKQKEIRHLYLLTKQLNGELEIDPTDMVFEFRDTIDLYNMNEILEYVKYLDILDDIINKTNKFINKWMDENKIKNYFSHDYFKAVDNYDFIFPITNRYYELKKHVLSLQDVEKAFNGYNLKDIKHYQELYDFLINRNNLIMLIEGYYSGVVDNLGVIISKWDEILEYANNLKISHLSLINAKNILNIIDNENNLIIKSLNHKIVEDIYQDGYYEINNVRHRLRILTDLYRKSFKRVTSSIPYVEVKNEQFRISVIDNYNQDVFTSIDQSLYRVGAIGNDLLHYSILDKNGVQIGIYEDDVLTNKVIGVRNGNTLYLNILEGLIKIEHHELLHLFAKEVIEATKDSNERIDFVTIVNNDNYSSRTSTIIDTTICPNVNEPIDFNSVDYMEFSKNDGLLNLDEFYDNYKDNITTLLASDTVIDKDSFKYYLPNVYYERKRNEAIKLSNNMGEEYSDRINTIVELVKAEKKIDNFNLDRNKIDTFYLGDDYVLMVTNEGEIIDFVLPYDSRAKDEVKNLYELIKKN